MKKDTKAETGHMTAHITVIDLKKEWEEEKEKQKGQCKPKNIAKLEKKGDRSFASSTLPILQTVKRTKERSTKRN